MLFASVLHSEMLEVYGPVFDTVVRLEMYVICVAAFSGGVDVG